MNAWLGQNVDEGTADVVGVAFSAIADDTLDRVFDRSGGIDCRDGAGVGGVLHIGRSERVGAARGKGCDGDGVVGGDADIHVRNVDPLWQVCKQQIFVVMK